MKKEAPQFLHSEITNKTIQGFYEVYNKMGVGFERGVYVNCLFLALKKLELSVDKNRELDLIFDAEKVGQMRADLVAENKVLVQIFSDKELRRFNEQKIYNQLKASELAVELILNFGLDPEFKRKDNGSVKG